MVQVPVKLRIGTHELTGFQACGLTGFVAACAVALAGSADRHLSLVTEAALIGTAVAVFLGLALATKIITGREALIYYHHELGVLAAVAAVARLLGAPVLAHLDATTLGLGAFLACGRVGCTFAGCCHGRPRARGIVYTEAFTASGFPPYLCGSALLPVQLIECGAVALLVLLGSFVAPATPGAAFGLYVTGYAVVRFWLEQLRGDPARRYWRGLSEAQWTSLAVAVAMAGLAVGRVVPGFVEHVAAASFLLVYTPFVAARPPRDLLDPRHVRELARRLPRPTRARPAVAQTALGVRVSSGLTGTTVHYTLSRSGHPLSARDADQLAAVIKWLSGTHEPATVAPGAAGTVHLVILPRAERT